VKNVKILLNLVEIGKLRLNACLSCLKFPFKSKIPCYGARVLFFSDAGYYISERNTPFEKAMQTPFEKAMQCNLHWFVSGYHAYFAL